MPPGRRPAAKKAAKKRKPKKVKVYEEYPDSRPRREPLLGKPEKIPEGETWAGLEWTDEKRKLANRRSYKKMWAKTTRKK